MQENKTLKAIFILFIGVFNLFITTHFAHKTYILTQERDLLRYQISRYQTENLLIQSNLISQKNKNSIELYKNSEYQHLKYSNVINIKK